jgi:hypothetical protein
MALPFLRALTPTIQLYRSPMPFGSCDQEGKVFQEYAENGISVVVPLAGRDECKKKAGRDLFDLYQKAGYNIIPLPIVDYETPDEADLRDQLGKVIGAACAGKHVVVHCPAGMGRTGMFMVCVAKTVLDIPTDEALKWLRRYIQGAVETPEQEKFIRNFKPSGEAGIVTPQA